MRDSVVNAVLVQERDDDADGSRYGWYLMEGVVGLRSALER